MQPDPDRTTRLERMRADLEVELKHVMLMQQSVERQIERLTTRRAEIEKRMHAVAKDLDLAALSEG